MYLCIHIYIYIYSHSTYICIYCMITKCLLFKVFGFQNNRKINNSCNNSYIQTTDDFRGSSLSVGGDGGSCRRLLFLCVCIYIYIYIYYEPHMLYIYIL